MFSALVAFSGRLQSVEAGAQKVLKAKKLTAKNNRLFIWQKVCLACGFQECLQSFFSVESSFLKLAARSKSEKRTTSERLMKGPRLTRLEVKNITAAT